MIASTDSRLSGRLLSPGRLIGVSTAIVLFGVLTLALRGLGVIHVTWPAALAPFTVLGVLIPVIFLAALTQNLAQLRALRENGDEVPTAPDYLEPPARGDDIDEILLHEHPELLAGICHGLAFDPAQDVALGKPVTDPWGIYSVVVNAPRAPVAELRRLSRRQKEGLGRALAEEQGRSPSDGELLKFAVGQFNSLTPEIDAGKKDVSFAFGLLPIIFAARSPNRLKYLRKMAPRVRYLLEKEYPSLATVRFEDGSRVRYAEWQEQAQKDRKELKRLRRARRRLHRRLKQAQQRLKTAKDELASLRGKIGAARKEGRDQGRVEQEESIRKLRDELEKTRSEAERDQLSFKREILRLNETLEETVSERNDLARALFVDSETEEVEEREIDHSVLMGVRVLLVGGNSGRIGSLREHLESHGIQLLHANDSSATDLVGGVHIVVVWTRFLDHPTYWAVKHACRSADVPLYHWSRTSPASLIPRVAQALTPEDSDDAGGTM